MHTQTKTRAPFGKQNHRELVPHFKQQFTMRHAPPAKSKHPGPANYNVSIPATDAAVCPSLVPLASIDHFGIC